MSRLTVVPDLPVGSTCGHRRRDARRRPEVRLLLAHHPRLDFASDEAHALRGGLPHALQAARAASRASADSELSRASPTAPAFPQAESVDHRLEPSVQLWTSGTSTVASSREHPDDSSSAETTRTIHSWQPGTSLALNPLALTDPPSDDEQPAIDPAKSANPSAVLVAKGHRGGGRDADETTRSVWLMCTPGALNGKGHADPAGSHVRAAPAGVPMDCPSHTCRRAGHLIGSSGWVTAAISVPSFAIHEPVMRRRPFTRRWIELTPIQEAAARAAAVLREGT